MILENPNSNPKLSLDMSNTIQNEETGQATDMVVQTDSEQDIENDSLNTSENALKTAVIPLEVYENLPKVLKEACEMFKSEREKDVFLTSAITVLSGCFHTVSGHYDGKKVYANLYSFIIAPAASGKSALTGAKDLGQGIHNEMMNQSNEENLIGNTNPPARHRMLFIPGNNSAAMIISILRDNDGIGIICETEADSLSNSFKQEWGGFSDTLRKAWHHEHISYARKQKRGEVIHIPKPKLSIAISGTPNQMPGMIKSIHDGLFSRFIFYTYENTPVWRDPSPQASSVIYETCMSQLQDHIKTLYDKAKEREFSFDLAVLQWLKLNKTYSKKLQDSITFVSLDTASNIFRLGLIHFRICMLFSTLRFFEESNEGNDIVCSDMDYSIAETLCDIYLKHGLLIYKIMTNQVNSGLGDNINKFLKALPAEPFKRKEAVGIGEKLKIAERTVNKYLKTLKENGFLKQDSQGGSYQVIIE